MFASNSIETLTLAFALVFMEMVSPYTMYLEYASVEVFNWNLLNDYAKHLFVTATKGKACACGCHVRHTVDAMLGIFAWSMKIMPGGVHPLTRRNMQPLDAQRSLLAGRQFVLLVFVQSQG